MIPFVCVCGGGRGAGRAQTTAAGERRRGRSSRTGASHRRSFLTLPAVTWHPSGANEAWSRRSSCVTACCGPTPTSHSGDTNPPPRRLTSVFLPLRPPLATQNHDEATLTWNNAKALNLHNANIWDIGLSALFFPSKTRTCRSSQGRQCFVSISVTISSQLLLLKLLPRRFCRWKAIWTRTHTENSAWEIFGSTLKVHDRSRHSLSTSSMTKGCSEHPSALTFA